LAAFSQKFDEGVKRLFSNEEGPQYVKFGSPRDNDPRCGIKAGRLTLDGTEVSGFFEPSIQSTVDSIRDNFSQRLATGSLAFLVGGFATSPWLSQQLERRLSGMGLRICKPDTHTNKAVAVGAVSFYVDHFVTGRISKFTYGVPGNTIYQAYNPEHVQREHKSYLDLAGERRIPDHFGAMLSRGTKVLEDREIRSRFCYITEGAPQRQAYQSILKYTGTNYAPEWMDTESDKYETLCGIRADLSTAPYQTKRGRGGTVCYVRDFEVVLLVGLTELMAQIGWIDSTTGEEMRSDAVVVYDNPSDWA